MHPVFDFVVSIVSPERCAACDERVAVRTVFCPACACSVVARPAPSGDDWAPFVYGGALAHAIQRFKYASRADLARPLGELLRRGVPDDLERAPEVVVPVPLHPARLVERGFNQATLLAGPAARQLRAPLRPRALERVLDTPRQALLDRARRIANLDGAFRARDPFLVGKRVLLVDDVRTTGATLRACALALRAAGAREVGTLVLAEVDV